VAFIVVYDANVLFPAPLRDLLIRLSVAGIVQARWTEQILDECFVAVSRVRPELTPDRLLRTRALMLPGCGTHRTRWKTFSGSSRTTVSFAQSRRVGSRSGRE
jgi:hypothetical protein